MNDAELLDEAIQALINWRAKDIVNRMVVITSDWSNEAIFEVTLIDPITDSARWVAVGKLDKAINSVLKNYESFISSYSEDTK